MAPVNDLKTVENLLNQARQKWKCPCVLIVIDGHLQLTKKRETDPAHYCISALTTEDVAVGPTRQLWTRIDANLRTARKEGILHVTQSRATNAQLSEYREKE